MPPPPPPRIYSRGPTRSPTTYIGVAGDVALRLSVLRKFNHSAYGWPRSTAYGWPKSSRKSRPTPAVNYKQEKGAARSQERRGATRQGKRRAGRVTPGRCWRTPNVKVAQWGSTCRAGAELRSDAQIDGKEGGGRRPLSSATGRARR